MTAICYLHNKQVPEANTYIWLYWLIYVCNTAWHLWNNWNTVIVILDNSFEVAFLESQHMHKGCYSVEALCSNHFCKLIVPSRKNPRVIFWELEKSAEGEMLRAASTESVSAINRKDRRWEFANDRYFHIILYRQVWISPWIQKRRSRIKYKN